MHGLVFEARQSVGDDGKGMAVVTPSHRRVVEVDVNLALSRLPRTGRGHRNVVRVSAVKESRCELVRLAHQG